MNPTDARDTSSDDEGIERELRLRLRRDDRSYYAALATYEVAVVGGHLTLTGHVRSRQVAHGLVEVSRRVRGVVAVDDRLVADDELERRAAVAIGQSTLNRASRLVVRAEFGSLSIGGVFKSTDARDEALRVGAAVPGAIGVTLLRATEVISS